tara:strand:- start:4902 stop:5825 length:924 start_codon:yes stop_codon:yes gene_type:complete
MIDIFIPSYHRADNIKTAKYFINKMEYDPKKIHVFIDDETDDILEYQYETMKLDCNLHIFNMEESRERFDYVHRPSESRRSAGQCRNMFYDFAKELGIDFYLVIDDDTRQYEIKYFGAYSRMATKEDLMNVFEGIKEFMQRQRIGVFGLSQTGDFFQVPHKKMIRNKVMNTTFYDTRFIYRGERGVQDNDTSQFVGIMNEGYFTGSLASGVALNPTMSVTQKGGLTDLYNENKLLNKSLIIPIQFPSVCWAEKQKKNGGRLHHRITYRYLMPKLIKVKGDRNNIAWDSYKEDIPFTNEPKRIKNEQK